MATRLAGEIEVQMNSRAAAVPDSPAMLDDAATNGVAKIEVSKSVNTLRPAPGVLLSNNYERRAKPEVTNRRAVRTAKRGHSSQAEIRGATTHDIVSQAERQHLEAIALLTRDIAAARRSASDAMRIKRYEAALAAINQIIGDTRLAVRTNPFDPVAAQQMFAAYNSKIDMLEELASDLD